MEESPKSQRENSNYRPYLAVPGLPILFMFFLIILNFHYINYPYHIVQYNLYRIRRGPPVDTFYIFPRIFCVFDSSFMEEQYKKNRGFLAWTISGRADLQNFKSWDAIWRIFFNNLKWLQMTFKHIFNHHFHFFLPIIRFFSSNFQWHSVI